VTKTSYLTLEALASFVAVESLHYSDHPSDVVTVRAAKPNALPSARSAEVELSRHRDDYPDHFNKNDKMVLTLNPARRNSESIDSANILPPMALARGTSPHTRACSRSSILDPNQVHTAAIALGTNMGDRFANIELALRLLEEKQISQGGYIAVVDTSFMYETVPMYVTDQPMFINCACLVRAFLSKELFLISLILFRFERLRRICRLTYSSPS
jgi:dihydroneopterin aldolase/2-amino-4-hydroxy-6-hydroxymethyldihydropteridine diphosphokinase/dihydropteroate synthase